jgi:hypothetical protein
MEVGRVGDLKIREGSIEPPAWSAISCLDGRTKNLSKKERRKIIYASRWSAVDIANGMANKKFLTETGLLMEVADDTDSAVAT